MPKNKSIDEELDELSTIYQRGGGIGEPGLEQEIGRRLDVLKHKQIQAATKANNRIALLNLLLTAINIGVLVYQIFFR
jgi:hypothetical protein